MSRRLAIYLFAGALALGACDRGGGADGPPEPGDTAVARVEGETVWASDVKREAVAQRLIGEGEPLDVTSELFRRVLDEVVDQKLLAREAERRKLDDDPLAQRRLAAARERILGDMLVEQTVDQAVDEGAIRALHQEQLRLSRQSEEFRLKQIVVPTEAAAQQVRQLVASGGSFDAVAMERSTDSATRFNGGDLGYVTSDVMPEAWRAPLADAKAGDVLGPIQTEAGWTVLRVEDRRREQPMTLQEARPQITRFLTYDQIRVLLEKLRAGAKVEVLVKAPADGPREPANAPAAAPPPAAAPAPRGGAPATAAPATAPAQAPATAQPAR